MLSPVHASDNVEATFDFVEATFDFVAKNGNNVKATFDFRQCFFDIVAGVDGALQTTTDDDDRRWQTTTDEDEQNNKVCPLHYMSRRASNNVGLHVGQIKLVESIVFEKLLHFSNVT